MPFHFSLHGPDLWYATRATGAVCFVLLTTSLVLGVVTAVRYSSARMPRFVSLGFHRNISLLTVVFLALHVLTTVIDTYTDIPITAAFVPFSSNYRTVWLSLGAVAGDLIVALIITSLVRLRLGYRRWRAIHWLSYVSWPVALVHALGTGTDPAAPWFFALSVACVGCVVIAIVWRLGHGWPQRRAMRVCVALLTAAAVVAVWAWAHQGPLAPNWSQRALPATSAPISRS
jgi:predicted ferric reductase